MVGQLLVRGLDDKVIEALKQRAWISGRSVEAEHREILQQALPVSNETFIEACARVRTSSPKSTTDSTDIIRAFRDNNWQLEGWDEEA